MKKLILLPLVIALAACASMDQASNRAPVLDAATLGAQESSAMTWPAQRWWTRYNDPQLDSLIEAAAAGSPNLVTAQARLARAQASANAANANLLPQISATGNATRQRYTENGLIPAPLAGETRTDAKLQLNLSYDFDFWNKNGAYLKAAVSESRAAEAETHAAQNTLTSSVASAYVNLQRLFSQPAVLDAAIKQRGEVVTLTQQRFLLQGLGTGKGKAVDEPAKESLIRQRELKHECSS